MGWGRACAKFYCRRGNAQRARSGLFQLQTPDWKAWASMVPTKAGNKKVEVTCMLDSRCTKFELHSSNVLFGSIVVCPKVDEDRAHHATTSAGGTRDARATSSLDGVAGRLGSSHKKQSLTGDRTGREGSVKSPTSIRSLPAAMASRGVFASAHSSSTLRGIVAGGTAMV